MKSWVLLLVVIGLPLSARAQDSIRINAVGLDDYYWPNIPAPIGIHIPAQSQARSVSIEVTIKSGNFHVPRALFRTDSFAAEFHAEALKPLDVELPILIPAAERVIVSVAATDGGGQSIGRVERDLEPETGVTNQRALIAVYCPDQGQCQKTQSQIFLGGNSNEVAIKDKKLRFIVLPGLGQHWWSYAQAYAVVVAGPISDAPKEQLDALTRYVRGGGQLILLEKEAANASFLSTYRQGAPRAAGIPVGMGLLYRVPDMESGALEKIFVGDGLKPFMGVSFFPEQPSANVILRRVGIFFQFPRLRWLLIWLGLYIVVVGPISFFILRRLGKLEWGWMTICAVSLLFAAGLYIAGSARRPAGFTLDRVAVYRMDENSPEASEDLGLRVSSPERGSIALSVGDSVVPTDSISSGYGGAPEVDIGSDITDRPHVEPQWQVDLGLPTVIHLSMLRWSLRDLEFRGFHEFPGTVHWVSPMRLRNDTGMAYDEAIFLDRPANKQYVLPPVAAGEEIDLTGLPSQTIWKEPNDENRPSTVVVDFTPYAHPPFHVTEIPYLGMNLGRKDDVFIGLTSAAPSAQLEIAGTNRETTVVTIVSLDRP